MNIEQFFENCRLKTRTDFIVWKCWRRRTTMVDDNEESKCYGMNFFPLVFGRRGLNTFNYPQLSKFRRNQNWTWRSWFKWRQTDFFSPSSYAPSIYLSESICSLDQFHVFFFPFFSSVNRGYGSTLVKGVKYLVYCWVVSVKDNSKWRSSYYSYLSWQDKYTLRQNTCLTSRLHHMSP